MASHTITLNLPETVYEQIQQAAETARRPINDVLVEAIAAVAPVVNTASDHLRAALAHMAYLNDAALWQAARTTMLPEQRARLATLHDKQQYTSLTPEEQAEEQALLRLYRETLLVRAQAAVLLKQRGYDVFDPEQFTPLI
jgi:hypothetical protein